MKLLITSLIILFTSFVTQADTFEAGTHYFELKNEVSKQPQVVEYFSFYCPACYRAEPLMEQVTSWLPESKMFKKNHVHNMPGRNPEVEVMLSKAIISADMLKVKDKMTAAIFNYIHKSRADFNTEKDLKNLFVLNGINAQDFDKTFNSFKVKMEAKKMQANTEKLRNAGYRSVPTLVINNKFIPNTKELKSMEQYKQLIQFLIAKTA